MLAGIIRSWLRPAQAQPVDDENSSLHVHVDAEGRAKDQIYWEREKERERKRTARANTRAQPAAGGASIELAPRLPIFHGTGSPSTVGPVPSVNELVAPVLDRKAERFPAHGGGAVSAAHLHPNPVVPAPPVIVPPSQPRSGRIGTTSATFNMAESHDHYVPPGGFSEPSAEECIALAAAEAARQREEEDALSAPAPPLPSQSPALSDIDYRTMNLSPGPAPSFLEPYYPRQNPPVATEALDQPTVHVAPLQQPVPVAPQSKVVPLKRISPLIPTTAPAPTITSGGGAVLGVEENAKLRQHKNQINAPEAEAVITAGESKHRDKGKDRQRQSHHLSEISPSSTRDKDKTRHGEKSKDRHKHKDPGDEMEKKEKKEKREKRDKRERKEKKERKEDKGHKGHKEYKEYKEHKGHKEHKEHKERGHRRHRDKQKEPIVQNPSGAVPTPEIRRIPPPKLQKEKENDPPLAKPVVAHSPGILKPVDASTSNGKQPSRTETTERKTVKVRTPEEQAAHLKRKEARRIAKEQERAIRQATEGNKGVEGATSTEHNHHDGHRKRHRRSKSSKREGGEGNNRHRKRDGESVEERSQRKAAKRAHKLAEALKAEPGNANSGPPLSEGNKRHSLQLELSGRILSPVPEGSTEPADSIRLPLSPAGYPIQPTTPIPNLPELPAGNVIRNPSRPSREPVAYTETQIPPRPSTPPPAAYSSQDIILSPAGAVHISQPRRRRSYDDKIVVLPEPAQSNQAEGSRNRPSKSKPPVVTPLVPHLVAATITTPESKEERRRRRAERAQLASQPYPPPAAAIVPPEEAHVTRQHRKKRSPEEIEAKRVRKEARKAKVAAANAALQAINEDEILPSTSAAHPTKGSRPELTLYQASALRNNSVVGLHQPDPRTQPGYGHYGYGTDGKTVGLTSPPPGKGPRHRKSVTIDMGARDGGPSYARDGREKERERERDRERDRERERQRKEKEKEAKAKQAQEAKEAKLKAQNTSGKRFGMFSLKRSFSKLFRA